MTGRQSIDVLVCGAGAAGLTLGIELARRGVRLRVIDRSAVPFGGSRGKGIQPRTQEVFEDLGILDRIGALGGLYPPRREYGADGPGTPAPMELPAPTSAEPYRLPLMVPQWRTEQVMRERLAGLGHALEFGAELVGFDQDEHCVVARVVGPGGEERIAARYLVGADGGRSFVRQALGIGFPGRTLGVRAVVADVALRGLGRDAWHCFGNATMDRLVHLCPLGGTDLFQLQAPVPPEGEVEVGAAALTAMIQDRTGRQDIIVDEVAWSSVYRMNARLADHYRVGRVFLVGDAAHVHPPTGGQGLNTSVQDAYNLGWKLASVLRGAPAALLDSYEIERRPIAAEVLGVSTQLLDAARRGDMLRGRALQQLDLGYPWSPLALQSPGRDGPLRAGDRAPDAPLRGAAGQARRLFDLFAGTHWTLLGHEVGGQRPRSRGGLRIHTIGAGEELRDGEGLFAAAYGVAAGDWVLVRPDGYVAAIVPEGKVGALEDYLQRCAGC